MKKSLLLILILFAVTQFSAETFNNKLTKEDRDFLATGQVLIRNINFERNICLEKEQSPIGDELLSVIHKLNPKYLAEVIQYKPYEGNEDLPQRLETILNNVPDYAGIPYYSERAQAWYDLYESATIKEEVIENDTKTIKADLIMSPFGTVEETITISKSEDAILYIATNENLLRYLDKFDCVWPQKMKIAIFLFRDGDHWILYGIGGVNAPRIPFFTERIQTSFINRINTFCSFIFSKF